MNGKVTIDQSGRVGLPKRIRDVLRVGPGDSFDITTEGESIILTPVRVRPELQKKRGLWVYKSGKPSAASISGLIDESRFRRSQELLGE